MDPNDWQYLAEGGANIIFRYIGLNEEYVPFTLFIYLVFKLFRRIKF